MKEVIRSNKSTGAIAPSSPTLAKVVTGLAKLDEAKVIVEFGPGTGIFTEYIEQQMRPDALFIALEVNEEFVKATRKRCKKVRVIHDGAQNTGKHLKEEGHEFCDVIVSGLPWSRFPDALQDEILDEIGRVLKPGGVFITFAYSVSALLPAGKKFLSRKLPERFTRVRKTKQIWKNFPPSVVYICEKD